MVPAYRWVRLVAAIAVVLSAWGLFADNPSVEGWLQGTWSFGWLADMPARPLVPETWRVKVVLLVFIVPALLVTFRPGVFVGPAQAALRVWKYGVSTLRASLSDMTVWERGFFYGALVLCSAIRIYQAITLPVMVDEALTWLLFATKGPLACATFYPAPNNHILHSLITSVSAWLPIDTLFALRLPVIFVAGTAQALLHLLLRRLCGPVAGLVAMVFMLGSPPFLYYGVFSRGYMLVLLAFIVAFSAVVLLMRSGDRRALGLLSISSVVGTFAVPSFLYPAILLFGYVFCCATRLALPKASVIRAGLVTASATLVLYLPALVLNGVGAFTDNIWVRSTGLQAVMQGWWKHFASTFSWLLGFPFALQAVAVLALAGLLMTRGQDRPVALFASFLLMASLAIPLVHGVIPFERTWIHLLLPITILLGLVVRVLTARVKRPMFILPLAMAFYGWGVHRFNAALPLQEYTAYHAHDLFEVLHQEARKDILCRMPTVGVLLVFEMERRGIPFTYAMLAHDEDHSGRLGSGKYALVIVDRSRPLEHPDYDEVYADGIQRLYRRRDQ